jgi:hypothetical protein
MARTFAEADDVGIHPVRLDADYLAQPHLAGDDDWLISQMVRSLGQDARSEVQRAYRQWNIIIRDHMRNETGLRLTVGDDRQGVPISIEDGIPEPFYRVLTQQSTSLEWFLGMNRNLIVSAYAGLEFISERLPPDALEERPPMPVTGEEVARVTEYVGWLERKVAQAKLEDKLQEIDQDVLGAYFYRVPCIAIFWIPIAIVARLQQVPVEALTVAVLAHEVAHAYTHLGKDIDGRRWETEAFGHTERGIVEGLAQFYSRAICDKLDERFPTAARAFDALLKTQSSAYTTFQSWVPKDLKDREGEVVRSGMIICRTQCITEYGRFQQALHEAQDHLSGAAQRTSRRP